MIHSSPTTVHHWSTADTPAGQRVDQFASLMADVLIPVRVSAAEPDFEMAMSFASFGPVTVVRQRGSLHVSDRDAHEIRRSEAHSFNIIANSATAWNFAHRGHQRLQPGDLTLHDSNYGMKIEQLAFEAVNIQISEAWIRQWVPRPAALLGHPVSCATGWGRALSAYVLQLTPELMARPPLPLSLIAEHIGALLALVAEERGAGNGTPARSVKGLQLAIRDCIRLRCCEASLTVQNVATSLNISPRTLHRSLAAHAGTFGALLIVARVEVAARMLAAPRFDSLTTAEIGRRAGFSDASHFTRAFRRLTGMTPLLTRRLRNPGG